MEAKHESPQHTAVSCAQPSIHCKASKNKDKGRALLLRYVVVSFERGARQQRGNKTHKQDLPPPEHKANSFSRRLVTLVRVQTEIHMHDVRRRESQVQEHTTRSNRRLYFQSLTLPLFRTSVCPWPCVSDSAHVSFLCAAVARDRSRKRPGAAGWLWVPWLPRGLHTPGTYSYVKWTHSANPLNMCVRECGSACT